MPYAEINGIELYYEEHGKGFPVVLAHGAGGNHLSWWQQVPTLSRHYRVITFDHRGWGLSVDTTDGGPEMFVSDLSGLLDHLEISEAFLLGQSMGGFTSLGVTMAHPERVKGLVLANTFAGMRIAVWLSASETIRGDAHTMWEERRAKGIKRVLAPAFSSANREHTFLYKQIGLLNRFGPNRLDSDTQVKRFRALERTEAAASKEALAAIKTPVLFIGGEHDEVMPVPLMEIAHSLIPGSEMVVIPGVSHSSYFEAPEVFNTTALDFFERYLTVTRQG